MANFNEKFRQTTSGLDTLTIWSGAIFGLITGVSSFVEKQGLAVSILLALLAVPISILAILCFRHRKALMNAFPRWLASTGVVTEEERSFTYDPADEAPNTQTYFDLMDFAVRYLLPACDAQIELQESMVRRLSSNKEIAGLAIDGLRNRPDISIGNFWANYDRIIRGVDSSEPTIKYSALTECIRGLERDSYSAFCIAGAQLATRGKLDYQNDADISPAWTKWRERHDALVREYEKIKSEVRFEKLFYPRRPGRWGNEMPPKAA